MNRSKFLISRIICLSAIFLLFSCTGQNDRLGSDTVKQKEELQVEYNQPIITFDSLSHDFGTIVEGEQVVCYFDYENTGVADLIVSSVEASCGCTTPDWSKEPLKPGDRKSLQIIFDATGRSGVQRKVVTVKTNASNSVVKITLKANIET